MKTHLKNCKEYLNALEEDKQKGSVDESDEEVLSTLTSVSGQQWTQQSVLGKRNSSDVSNTGLTSKKSKTYSIKTFLDREMTPTKEIKIRQRLVEMIAGSGISFQWIERPSTVRFLEMIRPSVIRSLPSRRVLGGRLLCEAAIRSWDDQLPKIQRLIEEEGVT